MNREEYITDVQVMTRANAAVKMAIEKKKITNAPIVVYDRKTKNIYHLHPDGTKTKVGERIMRGRYSEQVNDAEEA